MATVVRKLVTEWVYKVDATQLKAAEAMVKKLGEQIQKQMSAADKLSVRQNNHFAQMTTNYNKLTASMNKFRKAQFRLMNQAGLKSGWGVSLPGARFTSKGKRKRSMGGSAVEKVGEKKPNFLRRMGQMGFAKGQGQSVRFGSSGLSTIGVGASGAAAAGLAYLGKGILDLGMGFEAAQSNFGTLLGSQKEANKLLKELRDFAEKTPFELTKIRTNAQQILGAGFTKEQIVPTMKLLGDLAQGDENNFRLLLNNFAQIKNDNVALLKDIRQFSTVGIDIRSALRKSEGITEEQLSTMISQGKISFDMIKGAMKTLNSPGGPFYKGMERANKTLVGKLSQLKDAMDAVGEDASRGSVLNLLKEATDNATQWITDNRKGLVKGIENILEYPAEFLRDIPAAIKNFRKLSKDLTGDEDFLGQLMSLGGMVAIGMFSPATAFLLVLDDVVKSLADPNAATAINAFRNMLGDIAEGSQGMWKMAKRSLGFDSEQETDTLAKKYSSIQLRQMQEDTMEWVDDLREAAKWYAKNGINFMAKLKYMEADDNLATAKRYGSAASMREVALKRAKQMIMRIDPNADDTKVMRMLQKGYKFGTPLDEQKRRFQEINEEASLPINIRGNGYGSINNTNNNSDVSIVIQGYNRDPEELAQAIRRETNYVT